MRYSARVAALVAILGVAPAVALAQGRAPGRVPEPTPASSAAAAAVYGARAAAAASEAAEQGEAPATPPAASGSAHVVVPATGYGWSPRKKGTTAPLGVGAARVHHHSIPRLESPAVLPGFEMLADGSSRLFLQLSRATKFDAKTANGVLTYVIHESRSRRNDYNPLVTVHFNTPVSSARLVPHGRDLWFVVDLRAAVVPTVAMDTTKDGGAMLRIEFPRGNYLGGSDRGAVTSPAAPANPAPSPRGRRASPNAAPAPAPPPDSPAPGAPAAPAASGDKDDDSDGL